MKVASYSGSGGVISLRTLSCTLLANPVFGSVLVPELSTGHSTLAGPSLLRLQSKLLLKVRVMMVRVSSIDFLAL